MNNNPTGIFLILLSVFVAGCIPPTNEKPDDPRSFMDKKGNAYEVGMSLPYYVDYTLEMEKLKLDRIMKEDGPYTFFIPLPSAFSRFFDAKRIKSFDQVSEESRSDLLLYHIIEKSWYSTGLSTGYYPTLAIEKTTKNAIDLYINSDDLIRLNGRACMDTPDVACSNGMIHSIKVILEIPDVISHLSLNNNFSMFLELILRNDLEMDYEELLSGNGPNTIFAPDNRSMEAMLKDHPLWSRIDDIPADEANSIISNHMITDKNFLLKHSDAPRNITLANGQNIRVNVELTGSTPSSPREYSILFRNGSSKVLIQDIQSKNGVIHQIDEVMLP